MGVVRHIQNEGPSGSVVFDEPLSKHASLRIGGPASAWAEPRDVQAVEELLEWADQQDLPWFVVGLGSNVLFPDDGIDGLVMKLAGELATVEVSAGERGTSARVEVGAGVVNAHLVRSLLDDGWVGAEFLSLIPGTFGGAVAMNAGTKEGAVKDVLQSVTLLRTDQDERRIETVSADDLGLAYRHSELPADALVLSGTIRVERGDGEAARERMRVDRERREETQPYRLPSVGSTFANPNDGFAGELIERAGLKGARVGGAKISDHHANFFINDDDASAEEFLRLMAKARRRVREMEGIELRPEVRFVGFDGMARLRRQEARLAGEGRDA